MALLGREGLWGMIGVEKIGEIRRAYFEQHRSIKEIVRTLLVSRATVRKVVRGHQTEFKCERGVQPLPKLGAWVEVLTEILEQEAKLPKRERRSTQRLFEELRGRVPLVKTVRLPLWRPNSKVLIVVCCGELITTLFGLHRAVTVAMYEVPDGAVS